MQFEVISKAKIESYLQAKQEEERNPRPSTVPSKEEGTRRSSPATSARDTKASTQVCASTAYLCIVETSAETLLLSLDPKV